MLVFREEGDKVIDKLCFVESQVCAILLFSGNLFSKKKGREESREKGR
jgi:hypothetical protein